MRTLFVALLFVLVFQSPPARSLSLTDNATTESTIDSLLARMTLAEKIGQLNFPSMAFPPEEQLEQVRAGRIGAMLNVANETHIQAFSEAARASRLGIPLLFGIDAVYAFRIAFPPPIAWAATWRPELAEAASEAIARETSAIGVNLTFAPMVDISRDPRWGRVIEGAGEDAFLASAFAAARVSGYRKGGLATSAKHFVGYGAPEGGRDYNGAQISVSELHDRYLPPFEAAIKAGTETVMASFNTINGVPVTASRPLVNGLLKDKIGFRGLVMSDFAAISELINHGVAADLAEAARKAMLAGIDLDMEGKAYDKHLADEVAAGRVPIDAIDAAVRRVLRVKASLGLLESKVASRLGGPKIDEASVRETARKVARESFVLLKNDGGALPLGPGTRAIALIGAAALSTNDHSWHGPAGYPKPATETLLLALEKRMKPGQQLRFEKGFADECGRAFAGKDDAIAAARRADLVVLVVSEDCDISGEGASRTDLGLSGVQQEMLEELVETGRPVALVIETGRPLTLTYAAKNAVAILVAWHPGTEGRTALAEVLTGEISPSGRLPMTFPRSVGQIPIAYNPLPTSRPWTGNRYTTGYLDEEVTPLYPFGHGLTYSSFAYSGLSLSAGTMPTDGEIEVSVMLANTGKVAASEVVQLYTRQLVAARSRPLRELKGFDKVTLAPGERRRVRFRLAASDLAYHDDEGRPIVEPGPFKVFVGGSADADLSADFAIKAK